MQLVIVLILSDLFAMEKQSKKRSEAKADPEKTLVNGKLPTEPNCAFSLMLQLCDMCVVRLCKKPPRQPLAPNTDHYMIFICGTCQKKNFG